MEMSPLGKCLERVRPDGTRELYFASLQEQAWGYAFQHMTRLKEVEISPEILEDRRQELEEIVCQAQNWDFPMGGDRVLTTRGLSVRRRWWEGPDCVSSSLCSGCWGIAKNCDNCMN